MTRACLKDILVHLLKHQPPTQFTPTVLLCSRFGSEPTFEKFYLVEVVVVWIAIWEGVSKLEGAERLHKCFTRKWAYLFCVSACMCVCIYVCIRIWVLYIYIYMCV